MRNGESRVSLSNNYRFIDLHSYKIPLVQFVRHAFHPPLPPFCRCNPLIQNPYIHALTHLPNHHHPIQPPPPPAPAPPPQHKSSLLVPVNPSKVISGSLKLLKHAQRSVETGLLSNNNNKNNKKHLNHLHGTIIPCIQLQRFHSQFFFHVV